MTSELLSGPSHEHACLAYDDPDTLEKHARAWLTAGIAAGQRIWYVGSEGPPDGIDARHIRLDTVYTDGVPLDPEGQARVFLSAFGEALADGFTGLRVVADVTPLVRTPSQREAYFRYEHIIDRLMTVRRLSGMCVFRRREVDDEDLGDLASMHPITNVEVPFRLHACPPELGRAALLGELDVTTAERLQRAIHRSGLHLESGELVLNAEHLRFADHRTLLQLDRWAAEHDTRLVLRAAGNALARLAGLLDLGRLHVEPIR